ncbi:hypothetical protein V6N13_048345 [Hibiscus sabdariffa]
MEVGAMENDLNGGVALEVVATGGLGPNPVMTSFKDKLLSATGTRREMQTLDELDVEVREDDVTNRRRRAGIVKVKQGRGEERVTGLQATRSRFGILSDDAVTEEEGMVSTEEGVCTGSGVGKDIASASDTNVTLGAEHSSPLRRAGGGGIGKACTTP